MYIMQIAYAKEKPQATYKHSCFECSSFSFRSFSRDLFISITGDMEINHKMEIIANFQLNVKECWRLDRHVGKCGQIFFGFSSQLRNSCGTLKKFQQKCVVSDTTSFLKVYLSIQSLITHSIWIFVRCVPIWVCIFDVCTEISHRKPPQHTMNPNGNYYAFMRRVNLRAWFRISIYYW